MSRPCHGFFTHEKTKKVSNLPIIMAEMYDNKKHVEDTFTEENLSEHLKAAQKAELIELIKALKEIHQQKNAPLRLLDIGIGNGRVLKELHKLPEVWSILEHYKGIDIAQNCVQLSQQVINKLSITDKASVKRLDAINLSEIKQNYDIIISTWFTVGNFYPEDFSFQNFISGSYQLKNNAKLTKILDAAYNLLNPGGELIIGSMYIDNKPTRIKQENAYKNFGWEIITTEKDCFTATKDGWWSQRFTKQRVYDYLKNISKEKITFKLLDNYEYAMMVRIKK